MWSATVLLLPELSAVNTATEMVKNDLFLVSKDPLKNSNLKKQAPGKPFLNEIFSVEKFIVFSKKHYILCS
jgi:hypothetical protein